MQLKMDRIEAGIDMLASALDGSIEAGHLAAKPLRPQILFRRKSL